MIKTRKAHGEPTRGFGFVTRTNGSCGTGEIVLTPSERGPKAEQFRQRRVELGLSLRDAAVRLGSSPVQLSALERGIEVPQDAADWADLMRALEGTKEGR